VHVDRREIATGQLEAWRDLTPEDPTGVIGAGNPAVTRDGESYAYNYYRVVASDLYVMDGVR
jgi:hypothetical protein